MRYRITYVLLVYAHSGFCPAEAQQRSNSIPSTLDSVWEEHVLPTIEDGFDQTGYSILALGVGATIVANNQDAWVRREWRGEQKVSRQVTNFGAVWGSGGPSLVIAGLLLYKDPGPGMAFTEALTFTSLSHFTISRLSGRRRPGNPLIRTSFPSGHTANAWAMATSLSYSYGWKTAVPLYTAAALTMASRIADDRHWLSDTVAAAALGFFWGRASYFHHSEGNFRTQPVLTPQMRGWELAYVF